MSHGEEQSSHILTVSEVQKQTTEAIPNITHAHLENVSDTPESYRRRMKKCTPSGGCSLATSLTVFQVVLVMTVTVI